MVGFERHRGGASQGWGFSRSRCNDQHRRCTGSSWGGVTGIDVSQSHSKRSLGRSTTGLAAMDEEPHHL
jgi:hypothetical protein